MNTHRRTPRAAIGATVGTVLIALALAGCSQSNPTPGSPTTGSSATGGQSSSGTSSPTGSATSATPATSSSTTASATNTAGQRCLAAALRPATQKSGAAAGSVYLTIGLTNIGKTTCTLLGYPGVSIVGHGNGTQIGAPAQRDTTKKPAAVSLAVGHSTTFVLRVSQAANYPTPDCSAVKADGFRIYPPGSTDAVYLADKGVTGCAKATVQLLTVGPVGVAAD